MKQQVGAVFMFAGITAACASAPTCSATAQSNDSAECPPETKTTSTARSAARNRAVFTAIPIEDSSGKALRSFHSALRAAEEKRGQAHIVVYGASHVAADFYTDVIRTRLQARFGEAGTGFVLPAKALAHYRNAGITFEPASGWSGFQVKASDPRDDNYGLAGVYLLPSNPRRPARSAFTTRAHEGVNAFASAIDLYYWKQPDGGHFKLTVDGRAHEYSASAKTPGPAYERLTVRDGAHRIELATRGDGPVRVFGISLERNAPGVVLDTLGIPGSRAKTHLHWNDALYREHLSRRKPDLVILAYGTNEAGDDGHPIENYAEELRRVVARVREVTPKASCLLVGPSDRPARSDAGTYLDRPRTRKIVATQREVAAEFGCGFFDLVAFMGGPMSMLNWCDGEPPLGANDHIHFTYRGYEALGNVLHDALLFGYQAPAPAVVFGPRPLAPPGSTLTELNGEDESENATSAPQPKPRKKTASGASKRRGREANRF